ncbi:MAG TPA: hypothetical protein VH796_10510 [Nitrososphaeraceae archaeon]|jgi:hypothetical protein
MRNRNNNRHNLNESPDPWAQIIVEIISKLVGAKTSTIIKFENLEIESPRVKDPNNEDLGSVTLNINGKIRLTTTDFIEE